MHTIYDLQSLIEFLQTASKENKAHLYLKPVNRNWRNNHELCISNYEKMKRSRARILQQRDDLQKKNKQLKRRVNQLTEYRKLAEENKDLYMALKSRNAEIEKLKKEITRLHNTNWEEKRQLNIIKQAMKEIQ
ncbi:MAG: hypothetical protein IJP99_09830 [Methanobrevibacter sp.]|nr:hypothetical protein [Methanobrevibacter sp.]